MTNNKRPENMIRITNEELAKAFIDEQIKAIKEQVKEDKFKESEEKTDDEMTFSIPLMGKVNMKNVSLTTSAIVIGLVDGFNPCAMWILLFLISVLIGMKDRKRMWTLGLTFLLTSALVYMLIMLSWINIAVKITTIVWIRNIIALVAIIGGLLNLRSFIKSNDSGCDVVDKNKRKTIFNKLKTNVTETILQSITLAMTTR